MYSIIIYYFTGTGNGKRVADLTADAWRARGSDVIVQSVEGNLSFAKHRKADYVGIVAPVYGFGLPETMLNFLKTMPDGTGQKAFVLIATGNSETMPFGRAGIKVPPSEGIALLQARYWLKRRDYIICSTQAVEMPTNWTLAITPPASVRQSVIFENAQATIEQAVEKLSQDHITIARTPWLWVPLFTLTYWLFMHIGRRIGGKFFTATHRCNHCGYCRQHCPVGAIGWRYNRPYWGWNCQQCFRCVNFCPRGAIDVPWLALLASLLALIVGYMPYDWLPSALLSRLGIWNIAADTITYLLVAFVIAWLLHELYANPLTRRLLPRWYAMAKRIRYREPHFIPEPRVLEARRPRKKPEPAPETPAAEAPAPAPKPKKPVKPRGVKVTHKHKILVKPPTPDEKAAERKKWDRSGN